MDTTVLIKVSQKEKLAPLLDFLRSLDFISAVETTEDHIEFGKKLEQMNQNARYYDLPELTMDEINEEIKAYRREKQQNSH
jgi:hypothetical protein